MSSLVSMRSGALVNWAGMIALLFGNAMALDFMERVFAARDGRTARRGCYYGAVMTLVIGACVGDHRPRAASPRCRAPPTRGWCCRRWPSSYLPYWMGVMVFVGVLGASMSTANGAILVISVVLARNVVQRWRPAIDRGLGRCCALSRLMALPTAAAAGVVAYVRPEPGILLIVAFDIVLAGCVVPLFAGVYWPKANARRRDRRRSSSAPARGSSRTSSRRRRGPGSTR